MFHATARTTGSCIPFGAVCARFWWWWWWPEIHELLNKRANKPIMGDQLCVVVQAATRSLTRKTKQTKNPPDTMDTPWRMGRILVPPWSHGGVGLKIKIQIFRFWHTDDSKRKRKSGGNERRGNKTKNSNRPHHHRTSACCWSRTITPSGVCHCTGVCV